MDKPSLATKFDPQLVHACNVGDLYSSLLNIGKLPVGYILYNPSTYSI